MTQRSRKSTTLSTPKVASPSTENVPASATGTPAKKAPKAKKAGKDSGVVVPPINVLIVEGESDDLMLDHLLTRFRQSYQRQHFEHVLEEEEDQVRHCQGRSRGSRQVAHWWLPFDPGEYS